MEGISRKEGGTRPGKACVGSKDSFPFPPGGET